MIEEQLAALLCASRITHVGVTSAFSTARGDSTIGPSSKEEVASVTFRLEDGTTLRIGSEPSVEFDSGLTFEVTMVTPTRRLR